MSRRHAPAPVLAEAGRAPLTSLPGIGPGHAAKLAERGLTTLQDLWFLLPRGYQDRTRLTPIAALRPGQPAQVEGQVQAVERGFRRRPMLKVVLADGGAGVVLRFFHFRSAQVAQFIQGRRVRAYGTPRPGLHGLEIVHPDYRLLDAADEPALGQCLDPVYPELEGFRPATLRRLIGLALDWLPADAPRELLPPDWLADSGLPPLRQALLEVHRPPADADVARLLDGRHPAVRRLVLEELLAHHLSLRQQRLVARRARAPVIDPPGALVQALRARLPFRLTAAQERAFAQIRADLSRPQPMMRLVQGDVGSGKTVVAALAALLAVEQGMQVALAAPTELLAEQHLANLRGWLQPLGINVAWLAGKVTGKVRAQTLAQVADGRAQVVVGTHALMQAGVAFRRLALAIVDEQHRFGVHQRLALRDKGQGGVGVPHQLVMTATPIPRTLAMSAYADLDVSAIDELPPGRTPVQTVVVAAGRRAELVERIRGACTGGRQAYWVCTLIEENEEVQASAAQVTYEALTAQLAPLRVGLVHGRMKAAEKRQVMQAFKRGEIALLVATTVIEVGVDVPNASLMIIENAERLGLAQLHQLRGRVGRGALASTCVLLYQPPLSAMARARLQTLRQSGDGFLIAEKDLQLRGPGELLGTRQTGLASFRVADLVRDADLLPQVHVLAERLLAGDPQAAERLVERWVGSAARYAAA